MIAKNPAAALWASVAFVSTVFLFVTATIALGSPATSLWRHPQRPANGSRYR